LSPEPSVTARLARLRVPLGFVSAAVVLVLARPRWDSLAAGVMVACVGEAIRVWSAGHLEKSREVTCTGPYRWVRHPLYVGSSIIGVGVAVAGANVPVAIVTGLYLAVTLTAAIRTEEAFLRERFGDRYRAYCQGLAPEVDRRFSWARAWRNREWRAVVGLAVVVILFAAKVAVLDRGLPQPW
jgi:protein-S-isoprenylcysteine O-methyltransferase Ste14